MMTRNVKKTNLVSPMIWLCVLLVCACNQLENDVGLSLIGRKRYKPIKC